MRKAYAAVLIFALILASGVSLYIYKDAQHRHQVAAEQHDEYLNQQLEDCQAPYQKEAQLAQLQIADPYMADAGNQMMQHATDGLHDCQSKYQL